MKLPSKKSVDSYIQCDGYCPFCHSEHIEADGHIEPDVSMAWRDVKCQECEKVWRDEYKLIAISIQYGSGDRWYSDEKEKT